MTQATGIGSFPGADPHEAVVTVRDLHLGTDGLGLPYLPETPARGPGADLIGRGTAMLVDLHVDLQPSGWRIADRPGRDASRTAGLLRADLDELAEAYDGYVGPLKTQIAGPWTLAASLELPRGERVLTDPGACRDLAQSLLEGARRHVADLRRLIPGVTVIVQIDEPSLPAVLEGALPTASGYGRVRAVDSQVVSRTLRDLLSPLATITGGTVLHCCHDRAPVPLLRESGAGALALDVTAATPARWESLAATLESGIDVYAGCLPTDGSGSVAGAVRLVTGAFERVGLGADPLDRVTVTPSCGLAGLTVRGAVDVQRMAVHVAAELTEERER